MPEPGRVGLGAPGRVGLVPLLPLLPQLPPLPLPLPLPELDVVLPPVWFRLGPVGIGACVLPLPDPLVPDPPFPPRVFCPVEIGPCVPLPAKALQTGTNRIAATLAAARATTR